MEAGSTGSVKNLWAPWRLQYVTGEAPQPGCPFCVKQAEADEPALIVARAEHCFAVLNLFPYNPGHLMVIPRRHVGDLRDLTPAEHEQIQRMLLLRSVDALTSTMDPPGFNVGLNMGDAAGAGIPEHLHWHVVPRWHGDTNFMPVLADVRVMPQHLHTTWAELHAAFAQDGGDERVPQAAEPETGAR